MEDKLLELKEQFCKFYCPNKDGVISQYGCDGETKCGDCGEVTYCEQSTNEYIDLCDECKVKDFIIFIRDEL